MSMIRSKAASTRAAATARSSESGSDSSSTTASQSKSESSTSNSRSSTSTAPVSVSASSGSGKNSSHAKSESSVSSPESSKRSVLMLWCSPSRADKIGAGAVARVGRMAPLEPPSGRRRTAGHEQLVPQGARGGLTRPQGRDLVHVDLSDRNPGEFQPSPEAEEVGFEPTVGCPTHDFQSCRFGRSRTPPRLQPGQANGPGGPGSAGRRGRPQAPKQPVVISRTPFVHLGVTFRIGHPWIKGRPKGRRRGAEVARTEVTGEPTHAGGRGGSRDRGGEGGV